MTRRVEPEDEARRATGAGAIRTRMSISMSGDGPTGGFGEGESPVRREPYGPRRCRDETTEGGIGSPEGLSN
jgi:hypothetical protein